MTNRHPTRRRAMGAGVVIAWSIVGCVGGPAGGSLPPAPKVVVDSSEYSYLIGPGDTLNIVVARNPELSQTVPVRPDGKISAPLVDEVIAQGKTTIQLARELETRLARYVRDPVVSVIVTNFIGQSSEQVRVIGEAVRPQFLPFRQKMTLLDVMIAVGGLTPFAAGNRATIVRPAEGNKQYSVRLQDLVKGGDISANVEMRPGDIVIIPQGLF
jgi:polysaccharide biosynthesis/export protein